MEQSQNCTRMRSNINFRLKSDHWQQKYAAIIFGVVRFKDIFMDIFYTFLGTTSRGTKTKRTQKAEKSAVEC